MSTGFLPCPAWNADPSPKLQEHEEERLGLLWKVGAGNTLEKMKNTITMSLNAAKNKYKHLSKLNSFSQFTFYAVLFCHE